MENCSFSVVSDISKGLCFNSIATIASCLDLAPVLSECFLKFDFPLSYILAWASCIWIPNQAPCPDLI